MKLLVLLATCLVTLALAVPTAVRPIETLTVSRPLVHHTSTALRSRQFMPTDEWLGFYEEVVEKKCALVTIIFATGTHPRGNVGDVGLSLLVRAAQLIGRDNLVRQGVDYIGNFEHYFHGGAKDGGLEMARLAQLALSQCPDTQIVLGGYSQGAQIVHHSAHSLGPEVEDAVKAVVLFGDPDDGRPLWNISPSKVFTACRALDLICWRLPIALPNHFDYEKDADKAVRFIMRHVNLEKEA